MKLCTVLALCLPLLGVALADDDATLQLSLKKRATAACDLSYENDGMCDCGCDDYADCQDTSTTELYCFSVEGDDDAPLIVPEDADGYKCNLDLNTCVLKETNGNQTDETPIFESCSAEREAPNGRCYCECFDPDCEDASNPVFCKDSNDAFAPALSGTTCSPNYATCVPANEEPDLEKAFTSPSFFAFVAVVVLAIFACCWCRSRRAKTRDSSELGPVVYRPDIENGGPGAKGAGATMALGTATAAAAAAAAAQEEAESGSSPCETCCAITECLMDPAGYLTSKAQDKATEKATQIVTKKLGLD
eukprot:CAMPEP_0171452046 /NCGR_PEP_ID=MMETSP0945-20130129/304_1 /TAXON_ID=109269 /ORGANISM="Vaucheria litorea, Strain CCMP2940" /LENGTH=304 /DNA_ID=CAMNT_0011976621 /DNA_START=47 /DNA_END=961 /DNA_ORIENTATION=+